MANPRNVRSVAALRELLEGDAKTFYLVDYQGLSAAELTDFRSKVRESGARLLVAKNTLINVVLKEDNAEDLADLLKGPTGLVLIGDDPVAPAKAITDYQKASLKELPVPKGGMLQGKRVEGEQLVNIAKMPSRPQLQSELIGVLQGPLSQLVGVLQGAPRDLVNVLNNYAEKLKESE